MDSDSDPDHREEPIQISTDPFLGRFVTFQYVDRILTIFWLSAFLRVVAVNLVVYNLAKNINNVRHVRCRSTLFTQYFYKRKGFIIQIKQIRLKLIQ